MSDIETRLKALEVWVAEAEEFFSFLEEAGVFEVIEVDLCDDFTDYIDTDLH